MTTNCAASDVGAQFEEGSGPRLEALYAELFRYSMPSRNLNGMLGGRSLLPSQPPMEYRSPSGDRPGLNSGSGICSLNSAKMSIAACVINLPERDTQTA